MLFLSNEDLFHCVTLLFFFGIKIVLLGCNNEFYSDFVFWMKNRGVLSEYITENNWVHKCFSLGYFES